MARDTRQRLKSAALELFSSNYYDVVSVAQICRTAKASNGVFYRYYSGKEDIFRELLDDFLESFARDLATIQGGSQSYRLARFIEVVSGAVRRYSGQVTMFREGQYRKPEYERHLREVYVESVQRVLDRPVDEAEYLFLLSGLRFVSTRSLYHDLPINRNVLQEILERGLFGVDQTIHLDEADVPHHLASQGAPLDTREQLIETGIRLFGSRGFYDVQVADIVREAGFSVGTFYKRFDSKETFLAEIVRQIGRRTRHHLTEQAPAEGNRLDREVAGMWNFLAYFGRHREYYSIVREAEFVVPLAVKEYYDAFERGYMAALQEYHERKRQDIANFLMGLSHYLGIEVLFSDRVTDSRALVERLGTLLSRGISGAKGGLK